MFADEQEKRGFARRMSAYYGAIFVIDGIQPPYLPVWLDWRGLTPTEIGVVAALPLFARIVLTPAVALAADRAGAHRRAVVLLAWAGVLAAIGLLLAGSLPLIALAVFLLLVATYSAMPLAETIALAAVRGGSLDYGRMRLWGSLTFIAANVGGGFLLAAYGAAFVGYALLFGALATVLAAHVLAGAGGAVGGASARLPSRGAALELARSRPFVLLVLAAGAIQASHAVFYAFGVLHWRELGFSAGTTGALWAVGVLVEVGVLALSGRAIAVFGARGLLLIGGAAGVVRWTIMALDPPLLVLLPLQALHAGTFAATHIATVTLAQALAPEGTHGTAQAVLSAVNAGIAMGLAMAASGPLYEAFGSGAYLAMAGLAAMGILAARMITAPGDQRAP